MYAMHLNVALWQHILQIFALLGRWCFPIVSWWRQYRAGGLDLKRTLNQCCNQYTYIVTCTREKTATKVNGSDAAGSV